LENEPVSVESTGTASQAAIIPGGDLRRLDGGGESKEKLKQPIRFPQFYYMVSGLAAACFALFFVYWQRNQPVLEKKHYTEVDLTNFQASAEADAPVSAALPTAGETLERHSATVTAVPRGDAPGEFESKSEPMLALGSLS